MGFFEEKNASICYENIEIVVVNKVLILRRSYNTLFHYYNTLGELQGVGCKRELWEKLNKSACLYSKKDHIRDETFGLKCN